MGALVFVTNELNPFKPGEIGRVIYSIIKSMNDTDRRRSVVLLLESSISQAEFSVIFPSVRLILVDSDDERCRFETFAHHPPRFAYSNTDFHWKSAVVYRALRRLAQSEEIDYVEFIDFGGVGFASVQEKKISGFLQNACLAVRLHSTHALLFQYEAHFLRSQHLNVVDLERKTLRDCDLVVGHLASVAEATRRIFGIATDEWVPRLVLHAPPVLIDGRSADVGSPPSSTTPIVLGTKIQQIMRPDLFVRGVNAFCNLHPLYQGEIFLSTHSSDVDYRDSILKLVPTSASGRFHCDVPLNGDPCESLIARSVCVFPSDFESFSVAAYEASLLGGLVVINANNPAFGDNTPWHDGVNCIKFNGTALGLVEALERSFTLEKRLSVVSVPSNDWPWAALKSAGHPTLGVDGRNPLVSVLIPHFNLGSYLSATLASVFEQTYSNIEIIVIDDHSTERASKDVIESLRREVRDGFKVIVTPANLGLAAARNFGVTAARGKYILPLDADDLLHQRFIEIAVVALERNSEFDVIVTQAGYFEDEESIGLPGGSRDLYAYKIFVGEPLASGFRENLFSTATALLRAEILQSNSYREALNCYEDWNLYFRLAQLGHRFLVTTGVYFFYRNRHGSMLKAVRDPKVHAIFVHDALRPAIDMKCVVPLAYLTYCAQPAEIATIYSAFYTSKSWRFTGIFRGASHAARRLLRLVRLTLNWFVRKSGPFVS
jgi:glycosyltransferase involved in cell wall biosynthesis